MKIALIGYGKMGKAIEREIQWMNDTRGKPIEIILKLDVNNARDFTVENLRKADAAIEFTTPNTAFENILKCFDADVPVVCGTTGWTDRLPALKKICAGKKRTLFYASNFSVGVNLFFEVNRKLAELMNKQPQYEVTVHEIHHKEKKDAPSGTAIVLAKDIVNLIKRKKSWENTATNESDVLSVRSYREDEIPGIHLVNYESDFDSIEIKHTAHSRRGFALGAIQAALWLKGKKGFFEMKDMLGL